MKFKIKYVDYIPQKFIGMNYYASEEMHIYSPYPYPKRTILILKGMGRAQTKRTITHEKHEYILMSKGLKYHAAHIKSNQIEDLPGLK